MIKTNANYVNGSTAPQIEYNVYEENEVLKSKKVHRSNYKIKLKLVLAILFVFCCFLLLMYRYAFITELNYSVDLASKNYEKIKNENTLLKIDIEKNLDLNIIRDVAETKLGMHKPDKYQIVYVKVPKFDVTVLENSSVLDDKKEDESILVALLSKVNGFIKILD